MTNNQKHILIVDDDPLISRMYQKKLSQDGHSVETAENGEAAINAIGKNMPDLILLDVMMPKMNGVETLKAAKADPRTKHLKVIFLTNLGDKPEDIENAKKLGALEYLVKSQISLKELSNKVKNVLSED